jgi:hypothetical protein
VLENQYQAIKNVAKIRTAKMARKFPITKIVVLEGKELDTTPVHMIIF